MDVNSREITAREIRDNIKRIVKNVSVPFTSEHTLSSGESSKD